MNFKKFLRTSILQNTCDQQNVTCILPGPYQPGEKLTCTQFITHLFNYVKSIKTKGILLIRLQIQNKIRYGF